MVCWLPVQLEGHLIIRGHDDGAFDVQFVPANLASSMQTPMVRFPDTPGLEQALIDLRLDRDRVIEIINSPYVLHSLRVRIDRGAARHYGLVASPWARLLGFLPGFGARRPSHRPRA
jgi:hypothetical protein